MSRNAWVKGNRALVSVVIVFLLHSARCGAQEIRELGHFWTLGGTVQLLPTGNILRREEAKTTLYSYQQGHYVVSREVQIPDRLTKWTYFDWRSIDWHDQRDANDSDIPDGKFWPHNAKVKKVIYLSARHVPVVTALVCFTVPELHEEFSSATAKRIMLIALKGNMTENGYVYRELWTKALQKESSYGELAVQEVVGIGSVLVLYSASAGPSSESEQLDLYLLTNIN